MAQPALDARRLGRYPTILMSLLGLAIFGFGTAFVNSFHQYLFFRFAVSQALVCYAISSVCLGEAQRSGEGWGRREAGRGRGRRRAGGGASGVHRGGGASVGAGLARTYGEPAGLIGLRPSRGWPWRELPHGSSWGCWRVCAQTALPPSSSILAASYPAHSPIIPLASPPHGLYLLRPSEGPGQLLNPLHVLCHFIVMYSSIIPLAEKDT